MKQIVKFEKDNCPYCVMASNHLKTAGVEAVAKHPYDNEVDMEEYMGYGFMAFPLLVLKDADGTTLATSTGYNQKALDEMISQVMES